MVYFGNRQNKTVRPRLRRLQDLQTEIFRQLQLLIPEQVAYYDSFKSDVPGSPVLRLDILERHPYTHFLRLTYQFKAGEETEVAPDAHIRMYNDARLAEVTAFNPKQGFRRDAHPWFPQNHLFQRSWHQNRTLDKWLGYLLHQGHSIKSMQPAGDKIA
jgi:uncharacterized protein YqiB (DUF1249 family)